jgi:hypothetical protein
MVACPGTSPAGPATGFWRHAEPSPSVLLGERVAISGQHDREGWPAGQFPVPRWPLAPA